MKTSQYIAVFQSLAYAGQIRNLFWSANRPEIIKTPKSILGGCSYALTFSEEHRKQMLHHLKTRKKGFLGLYMRNAQGRYEELTDGLSG